jgi:hypothetical protein
MDNNKSDFSLQIMQLETEAAGIKAFKDPDQYEEVATMVKNIQIRIQEAIDYAKMINNRESLVELEDSSDYSGIQAMNKEFKPFHDLWTVVE